MSPATSPRLIRCHCLHRVVPGLLETNGDGRRRRIVWFEDEIHPRLRFAHRGLLGINNDRADELQGKPHIIGRVVGNMAVFSILKIGDAWASEEFDKIERPVIYPPKIKSIRIVDNSFDDIVPHITAVGKRAQRLLTVHSTPEEGSSPGPQNIEASSSHEKPSNKRRAKGDRSDVDIHSRETAPQNKPPRGDASFKF
ncbi:uncharacterized protein EI90DRAFT_3126817 [Cantharellus anzutake]|uniref:uncharacterized protein n=1 Tax=Cantharellus anzutake TaxID=1750568 RepID=UPI0019075E18|nr:uncharacterized protein EI90DRAFT_3126817 [Cantharellus anzutake]KAF8327812.1 hypothetical protein EI90DRAFT_3126817 [Cantharellus anzutake]